MTVLFCSISPVLYLVLLYPTYLSVLCTVQYMSLYRTNSDIKLLQVLLQLPIVHHSAHYILLTIHLPSSVTRKNEHSFLSNPKKVHYLFHMDCCKYILIRTSYTSIKFCHDILLLDFMSFIQTTFLFALVSATYNTLLSSFIRSFCSCDIS